uniref:N-terminal asparagine amidase n=1 Tax=Macaca fascicularis TaxID=9541 RepID=A0A7N9C8N6_MACFA
MNSIKSFSDHAQCGRLEVHLVGGFSDDRQLSQKLTHQLLSEFDRQEDDIHLVTLCVTELNDREENENHFPIIYGIAVNIKTAEIYRASFQDRGPEEQLRAARTLAGGPVSLKSSLLRGKKKKGGGASNIKALSFLDLRKVYAVCQLLYSCQLAGTSTYIHTAPHSLSQNSNEHLEVISSSSLPKRCGRYV